ncbi:hypothetical protein [Rahnella sp. ChDrAdgB13]|uniref:hypothetical protein n=1 Tax=Rahnella sp. ChDrAdgB13 TaxID=1850581 RepID=UPI001AD888D4|nr:hypothetical protein [Rahnella sp. ChDrAdgB13]
MIRFDDQHWAVNSFNAIILAVRVSAIRPGRCKMIKMFITPDMFLKSDGDRLLIEKIKTNDDIESAEEILEISKKSTRRQVDNFIDFLSRLSRNIRESKNYRAYIFERYPVTPMRGKDDALFILESRVYMSCGNRVSNEDTFIILHLIKNAFLEVLEGRRDSAEIFCTVALRILKERTVARLEILVEELKSVKK